MSRIAPRHEDAELNRLQKFKQINGAIAAPLGPELVEFFKQTEKRQGKFGKVGQAWRALVPQVLNERCCLESFSRGTLTVLVDSASHMYDLKQLLLAGLQQQLLLACKGAGLRKISLKRGRWYDGESPADGKLTF